MTDNWFTKLCFNAGHAIHTIVTPPQKVDQPQKTTVNKTVEEEKLSEQVTLRRTTIEEIEIKQISDDKQ
ncbi:MAG: hypothetical protein JKX85_11160 [Phycisphaeraceae bacterium]|nr:hypothetical protein [Phycisphaeraceae bacterium]